MGVCCASKRISNLFQILLVLAGPDSKNRSLWQHVHQDNTWIGRVSSYLVSCSCLFLRLLLWGVPAKEGGESVLLLDSSCLSCLELEGDEEFLLPFLRLLGLCLVHWCSRELDLVVWGEIWGEIDGDVEVWWGDLWGEVAA